MTMMIFNKIAVFSLPFLLLFSGCASVKKGDKKFQEGKYNEAAEIYTKVLKSPSKKINIGEVNYKTGEAYRLSNQGNKTINYYEEALQRNFSNPDLNYHYATALVQEGNYSEASEQYKKYISSGNSLPKYAKVAKKQIAWIAKYDSIKNVKGSYTIGDFEELNTAAAEFSPFIFNKSFYFTSSRDDKKYATTGTGFFEIYRLPILSDTTIDIAKLEKVEALNMKGFHDASATISPDGKLLVFARSNSDKKKDEYLSCNLYYARKVNDTTWGTPKLLPFSSKKHWDACPMFGPDGTLYFASDRSGKGGTDIFKTKKKGAWTRPKNMGSRINTSGNEYFPFVHKKGSLFFSSDGHGGYGGLDVYNAQLTNQGVVIRHLPAPINSAQDDFGYISSSDTTGFFSSNRTTGKGDDDIYWFKKDKEEESIGYIASYFVKGTAETNNKAILDGATAKLINAEKETIEEVKVVNNKFTFSELLMPNQRYSISVTPSNADTKEVFLDVTPIKELKKLTADTSVVFEVKTLHKIDVPKEMTPEDSIFQQLSDSDTIQLDHIYYDYDKWNIRPDAAKELDKLVSFMQKYTHYQVELGSHTDARGKASYNKSLSQKRAESAVAYIISKGIKEERIIAKGYGEDSLKIKNAKTEAEHQSNRRTTVRILDKHFQE